jgi:hypothetical protein
LLLAVEAVVEESQEAVEVVVATELIHVFLCLMQP